MKKKEDMAYLGSENMTMTTGTISTKYLEGFNDGYKKAMEQVKSESSNNVTAGTMGIDEKGKVIISGGVFIDGKKIGESIYPDIKLLSKQEEKMRSDFNAN